MLRNTLRVSQKSHSIYSRMAVTRSFEVWALNLGPYPFLRDLGGVHKDPRLGTILRAHRFYPRLAAIAPHLKSIAQ